MPAGCFGAYHASPLLPVKLPPPPERSPSRPGASLAFLHSRLKTFGSAVTAPPKTEEGYTLHTVMHNSTGHPRYLIIRSFFSFLVPPASCSVY